MASTLLKFTLLLCVFSFLKISSSNSLEGESILYKNYKLFKKLRDEHNVIKDARRVVHKSKWASVGTIFSGSEEKGFPMVNIVSVSDELNDKSTGNIYFMLIGPDFTRIDIDKNNRTSFTFTDEQDLSCTKKNIDPMEPTCVRVVMFGGVIKMDINSDEYKSAWQPFLKRHPAANNWIKAHTKNTSFCKLAISKIYVLNNYGGPHDINLTDYFNANTVENDVDFWDNISNYVF